jgi:hypothetical protein
MGGNGEFFSHNDKLTSGLAIAKGKLAYLGARPAVLKKVPEEPAAVPSFSLFPSVKFYVPRRAFV